MRCWVLGGQNKNARCVSYYSPSRRERESKIEYLFYYFFLFRKWLPAYIPACLPGSERIITWKIESKCPDKKIIEADDSGPLSLSLKGVMIWLLHLASQWKLRARFTIVWATGPSDRRRKKSTGWRWMPLSIEFINAAEATDFKRFRLSVAAGYNRRSLG
jgi:hypothetical protein